MRLRKVRSPDFVSRAAAHDKKVKRRLVRDAESAPVTYKVSVAADSPPNREKCVKHLVENLFLQLVITKYVSSNCMKT